MAAYGHEALYRRAVVEVLRQMWHLQRNTELTTGDDTDEQVARYQAKKLGDLIREIDEAEAQGSAPDARGSSETDGGAFQ